MAASPQKMSDSAESAKGIGQFKIATCSLLSGIKEFWFGFFTNTYFDQFYGICGSVAKFIHFMFVHFMVFPNTILMLNMSISRSFIFLCQAKYLGEMVFCYQNCTDLLWERIVLVIEKNFWNSRLKAENLQNFWGH